MIISREREAERAGSGRKETGEPPDLVNEASQRLSLSQLANTKLMVNLPTSISKIRQLITVSMRVDGSRFDCLYRQYNTI